MAREGLSKLARAGNTAQQFLTKRWEAFEEHRHHRAQAASEAQVAEEIRQRNEFLSMFSAKLAAGPGADVMPPLRYPPLPPRGLQAGADTKGSWQQQKAVVLATVPVVYGPLDVSRRSYHLLAKHVGMSLSSVSHWAICVIDRNTLDGPCWCYDLMSDQISISMLGKSYLRVYEATPEIVDTWSSMYYVGETTKTHEEIQELGNRHLSAHPRYNLLSSNCQHLVEILVQELCDGKMISQAKLEEELRLASPRVARDLLVARLRSRIMGGMNNNKDGSPGSKEKEKDFRIEDVVGAIKSLERTMGERESWNRR